MVRTPLKAGAFIIDANVAVAITSKETGRDIPATEQIRHYSRLGYECYAPGTIIMETLYALCQKHKVGILTDKEFDDAVIEFEILAQTILPPPNGEASLIQSTHYIGRNYGCSRSADALYIALAQQLCQSVPTVLLTFDQELPKQAARNAPGVSVIVL